MKRLTGTLGFGLFFALWAWFAVVAAYDHPCHYPNHPGYAFYQLEEQYGGRSCTDRFYSGLWFGILFGPLVAAMLWLFFAIPIGVVIWVAMVGEYSARRWLWPRSAP